MRWWVVELADFVSTGRTAIALANGDFSAPLESKQDPRMAKKRQKGSKRAVLVILLLKQKKPENHMQISIT